MNIFRHIYDILTPHERRNLYILFAAVLVMAGLEVISIASILPFLSVASEPDSIHENVYLDWAYTAFNFDNAHSFLITTGLFSLVMLIVSNIFIICVHWLQYRYVWNRNHSISKRLLEQYLRRPYEYFLTRNSADLSANILAEVMAVTTRMLQPAIAGLAKGIVSLAIIGFLIFIDPMVAVTIALVLGGAYGSIYLFVRKKLDDFGSRRVIANRRRYQSVNEALGGIKDIKLRGKEKVYVEQFAVPSARFARFQALNLILSTAPRYVLEGVAFGGIILIAVYLIAIRNDLQQVIPLLGLYAFAGYRLLPALQQAFAGLANARFNKAALETLHRDIQKRPIDIDSTPDLGDNTIVDGRFGDNIGSEIVLAHYLTLENVVFTYPGANEPVIRDLSLNITAQSTVGFVGKTGSGKTTVIDLLLGLLRPQQGCIQIDDTKLHENNLTSWQRIVGYVPQHIYLTDDTIAQNVAFGVPANEIDYGAVKEALECAQLDRFVREELPHGVETLVGERGVKLSGGQRQRIGIARALYYRPVVLFFDEATSALDAETEQAVMDAVYALGETRTVVLVSHRLSTVRRADNIFMLQRGKLVGTGTYGELMATNTVFKNMVLSNINT